MTMRERMARAMEAAEIGYEMKLVSLINGISTYRPRYSDGEVFDFGSTDEVYEHIADRKRRTQVEAVLDAMRETDPSHDMMSAMWSLSFTNSAASFKDCWQAMIDHIRNEGKT